MLILICTFVACCWLANLGALLDGYLGNNDETVRDQKLRLLAAIVVPAGIFFGLLDIVEYFVDNVAEG